MFSFAADAAADYCRYALPPLRCCYATLLLAADAVNGCQPAAMAASAAAFLYYFAMPIVIFTDSYLLSSPFLFADADTFSRQPPPCRCR